MMNIEDVLKGHGIGIGDGGSSIKNTQKGVILGASITTNITLSEVTLSKTIVRITVQGLNNRSLANPQNICPCGELTSATNLRITVGAYSDYFRISWEVIEFSNIKKHQTGNITGFPQNDANNNCSLQEVTIATIDPLKSLLFYSCSYSVNVPLDDVVFTYEINSDKLKFRKKNNNAVNLKWYLIEFK